MLPYGVIKKEYIISVKTQDLHGHPHYHTLYMVSEVSHSGVKYMCSYQYYPWTSSLVIIIIKSAYNESTGFYCVGKLKG